MSTKAIVIAAIAFFLLLLVGAVVVVVVLTNRGNTENTTNNTNNTTNNTNQDDNANDTSAAASASISDFLASGDNKRCTYVDGADSGTMYFAGGNLRADFVGPEGNGSMVIREDVQYVWDSEEKTGVMFNLDATEDSDLTDDFGGVDVNQNFSFTCTNWNVDASMFMPPSDVTITDFSELFNF